MLQSTAQMATIQEFLASEECKWSFIPPNAEHFGGLGQAAVKSMKYHLWRKLGSHVATYEELCTLLSEIEACPNSRHLCALSDNTSDSNSLSPGHFLIGEPFTQLPAIDLTNVKFNRLSSWQIYLQQVQHFWQRRSKDYLQSLDQRHSWLKTTLNLQPGDLLLVSEDNTTPLQWPRAVI